MTVIGTLIQRSNPYNDAIRARQIRRENADARWNDPEMQRRDAERRKMEGDRILFSKIDGLKRQIDQLRTELETEAVVRTKKEATLKSAIEQLAELTEPAPPIAAESEADEPVADPVEVEASAPRRGRPRKVPHE